MGVVRLNSARDLQAQAGNAVAQIRSEIVQRIVAAAKNNIREKSNDKHVAEVEYMPDGFIIGEPVTNKDPDGSQALAVERDTGAYADTHQKLSDKAYITTVINKG